MLQMQRDLIFVFVRVIHQNEKHLIKFNENVKKKLGDMAWV